MGSTVYHYEHQYVFRPTTNVTIAQPLICGNDIHIVPAGQTSPVVTLGAAGVQIMTPGSTTPSLTLGTNGVVTVSHLETQTISVNTNSNTNSNTNTGTGTGTGGTGGSSQTGSLEVGSFALPAASPEPDGSIVVPIDTSADSVRFYVRLDTSGVSGTLAITLDASLDGGATYTCSSTAAITAVAGSVLMTISNQPAGAETLLAYNLQGAMQIIEGTHYAGAATSLLRICTCGTLADTHAVRTEGTVAFLGNPTHLRFHYSGLPIIAKGAVVAESAQS